MPNSLAFLMLLMWPVVTVVLFRKLPVERALIATMVAGYLILPEPPAVFDFPLLPPLTKHNIPALVSFGILVWMSGSRWSILPESLVGRVLLVIFVLSPILTVLTNPEPVFWGAIGLPGLGIKDAFALTITQFLIATPFLMARQFLASGGAQRDLLMAFMWGGLFYSVLMLIEMRLSPQLNLWIYGYFQHFFGQSIRFGGYRPVVFLYHGLWVAFFALMAVTSAWALWRNENRFSKGWLLLFALYLTAILVLSKSLGALIFAVGLLPLVIMFGPVQQIKAAMIIGSLAFAYPVLKGADVVPEAALLQKAGEIDQDRRASLDFRFNQERILLDRAYLKPMFGWGSWGRNHILDPVSGNILTITDGRWIITIGVFGWVGFVAEFGLLLLPILLLWREATARRKVEVTPFIAPLSLILAINMFDMLPNATLTPLTWLLAGALTGYAEALKRARLAQGPEDFGLKWKPIL